MNATTLSELKQRDFSLMTIEELKSVKRAAGQAYATVGDNAKYNSPQGYNYLERTEKLAQVWIDIKEGR